MWTPDFVGNFPFAGKVSFLGNFPFQRKTDFHWLSIFQIETSSVHLENLEKKLQFPTITEPCSQIHTHKTHSMRRTVPCHNFSSYIICICSTLFSSLEYFLIFFFQVEPMTIKMQNSINFNSCLFLPLSFTLFLTPEKTRFVLRQYSLV